ncbi:sphingosine-1-phosphate lyase [Parasteatoda tepidariorum]|uniref:sphingosine-1-phosphate lyase n=1 Tax=Parasteatoda tepidariorum TaxID=114398 RepID=UPI00077FCE73|nr:sphingosine-1-phosphate lyase [Parasteatoda tepidariorum]XP_015929133.1 sphingosine-1-phosphate lyase [Parasteatoda tepidariorum]
MDVEYLQLILEKVFTVVVQKLTCFKNHINDACVDMEPWLLIFSTAVATFLFVYFRNVCRRLYEEGLKQQVLYFLRHLPIIKQGVAKKLKETTDEIEKQVQAGIDVVYHQKLPKQSYKPEAIIDTIKKYSSYGHYSFKDGYVSGTVYLGNDAKLGTLMKDVYGLTAYTNPLHPDVFPGSRIMEAEVVQMVSSLFKATESVGTVTSGGTESIFLVCKAYRDYAKFEKGIRDPNMVIPITAHAGFDKAAHMLKIKVKHVPFDPETTKVNMKAMKKAIDKNTIMLVGSAPAFPHGSIDPIEAIGQLGYKKSIPVHVDACLGGFLIPFMEQAGFKIPAFDFSVRGVTSISCDTHKYGYAPKGTSVILYKEKKYRHHQFSVQPNWPGGIYGTPNLSGSRSGGLIATCWASLLYHGEENYIECTRKIMSVAKYIEKGLRKIEGIHIVGKPDVSVIAIGSEVFDVYRLTSSLTEKGWNLNVLQYPSAFHICLTMQHTYEGVADRFLSDVEECTKDILKTPGVPTSGRAAIYGMAQQIPDRSLVSEITWAYLDACYSTMSVEKTTKHVQNGNVTH